MMRKKELWVVAVVACAALASGSTLAGAVAGAAGLPASDRDCNPIDINCRHNPNYCSFHPAACVKPDNPANPDYCAFHPSACANPNNPANPDYCAFHPSDMHCMLAVVKGFREEPGWDPVSNVEFDSLVEPAIARIVEAAQQAAVTRPAAAPNAGIPPSGSGEVDALRLLLAQPVSIDCTVDVSAWAPGRIIAVGVKQSGDGKLAAYLDGALYNPSIHDKDFIVRAGLDFTAEPGAEFNFGESTLLHIAFLGRALAPEGVRLDIRFDLAPVAKVRIYEFDGNSESNRFGGSVLIEAYDGRGALLGRAFRSVFVNGCN